MSMPEAGQIAPDFTLSDENGDSHTLSGYRGKIVLLYFYPRDDTSGCTTEACNFRDDYSAYQEAGVVILGVSADDEKSHLKFKTKYDLPFTLLADVNKEVVTKYGVYGTKKMYGREYMGIFRTTFLIGVDGKIIQVFEKVKPASHSAQILEVLDSI